MAASAPKSVRGASIVTLMSSGVSGASAVAVPYTARSMNGDAAPYG